MYHDYYQLKENPFNVTADPDFFFSSRNHSEAFSNLLYGVKQRKGILVITGEIGTGKTTLCRKLLKHADNKLKFALILNPNFSEIELLQIIMHDLGISVWRHSKFHMVQALNKFLLKQAKVGRNVVLVIDEAQNLSVSQLEQLRLLSNFETEKEKLLQIILVGQPELHEKLQLPELRQLRQRITVYHHIHPLQRADIKYYIHHRIKKAGYPAKEVPRVIFTEQALDKVYQFTQGSPRIINILCDRALLAGYVADTFTIDEYIIENCAKEVLYCEHHL